MAGKTKLYGLVISGGSSIRMGCDKAMLMYHKKPQVYHVYEMLETVCDKVYISCNTSQLARINKNYPTLADLPVYEQLGPMAALLTAFDKYPGNNFLVVGCDYPFVKLNDVTHFHTSIQPGSTAAAFYNYEHNVYEPLLAWYSSRSNRLLLKMHKEKNHSLQYFLKKSNAYKYYPTHARAVTSVDTPAAFIAAKLLLKTAR